ncbi:CPBP family intramembrane glutamic endopeptidase [Streptomyces sp. NPDC001177]
MSSNEELCHRPLLAFFALVTVLSLPFWCLGALFSSPQGTPIGMPVSALMVVCPVITACILVCRHEGRAGVVQLLKRAGDFSAAPRKGWYLIAAAITPVIATAAYALTWLAGFGHPAPSLPFTAAPVLFAVFLLAAACEEVGWTGYATDPMLRRWGSLTTAVLLGGFWGLWHVVPLLQAHHDTVWITGWFLSTMAARVIIVWLYVRSGRSVLSAMCLHATLNVCTSLTPQYELDRAPWITGGLTALVATGIAAFAWRSGGTLCAVSSRTS